MKFHEVSNKKFNKKYGLPLDAKVVWMTRADPIMQQRYQEDKMRVWKKIQDKIECVRCGCNDIRFLEINHKNGGGAKEAKKAGKGIVAQIECGRTTDDLELLCRPCNHIHYLEMKFKTEIPLKVIFQKASQKFGDVIRN